jgi:general secretion pathway protein J
MSFESKVKSQKSKVKNPRRHGQSLKSDNAGYWLLATGYCSRGFTLLEVLVASAILSLVLAALYGVFSRTLTSKRLAEERAVRARTARIALLRIGEDLQSAFPPGSNTARFVSRAHRATAFPEDTISFVSLTRVTLTSNNPEGDLCEIGYAVEPDPLVPTQRQLIRRVSSALAPDRNRADETVPLLLQVRGLRFRFFDGRSWQEEWGQEKTQNTLPQAVEVVLYLPGSREEVAQFSTVIDLPLANKRRAKSL